MPGASTLTGVQPNPPERPPHVQPVPPWRPRVAADLPPVLPLDQRRARLADAVGYEVAVRSARVESQGDVQAALVYGHRPNHVLHLILTVLTLGLWVPVWLIVAATTREVRVVLYVDEWGHVIRR